MTLELADRQLDQIVSRRAAARLRQFRHKAEAALPGRIARVVLFGSRARGDARRDSDYDVAVFVERLEERRPVDHALSDIAYGYLLDGFHISPVALPADFLDRPTASPLKQSIVREGVPIW